jgi:hypothetical protein
MVHSLARAKCYRMRLTWHLSVWILVQERLCDFPTAPPVRMFSLLHSTLYTYGIIRLPACVQSFYTP